MYTLCSVDTKEVPLFSEAQPLCTDGAVHAGSEHCAAPELQSHQVVQSGLEFTFTSVSHGAGITGQTHQAWVHSGSYSSDRLVLV